MALERTCQADRVKVVNQLRFAFNALQPPPTLKLDGHEIPIREIVEDFTRFLGQATYYARFGHEWPCVLLDRLDFSDGQIDYRVAPMDIDLSEVARSGEIGNYLKERISNAQRLRIPIVTRSIEGARHGFVEGAIDTIIASVRSFTFGSGPVDPTVTVTTTPKGETIMYAKGHFFNDTGRGFGRSDCSNQVKAATYCFYRASETPNVAMPLWDIVADQTIYL